MTRHARRLDRLQRAIDRRRPHDGGAPIPYRLYDLDADGRRVYVAPTADDLAIEEWARQLVLQSRL